MSELGDSPEARRLFDQHLALCESIVTRFQNEFPGLSRREELLSSARGGLWEAACRFDPERGVPFPGYAHARCRGAIVDGVRATSDLPRRTYERVKALMAVNDYCHGVLADSYAVAPGMAPADFESRLGERLAGAATAMALALAAPPPAPPPPGPDAQAERSELLALVEEGIATLTDAEATLVRRHYLGDESIEKIAADLGLTKSWGSRLLARGVNKLTKRIRLH